MGCDVKKIRYFPMFDLSNQGMMISFIGIGKAWEEVYLGEKFCFDHVKSKMCLRSPRRDTVWEPDI